MRLMCSSTHTPMAQKPLTKKKRIQLKAWVGPRNAPRMTAWIEQPTDDEIRAELLALPGGEQISSVEIRISKTHEMAMAGSVSEGFYVRYEEYSAAGRWEAVDNEIPLDLACRILTEYRDGADTWRKLTSWRRIPFKAGA